MAIKLTLVISILAPAKSSNDTVGHVAVANIGEKTVPPRKPVTKMMRISKIAWVAAIAIVYLHGNEDLEMQDP